MSPRSCPVAARGAVAVQRGSGAYHTGSRNLIDQSTEHISQGQKVGRGYLIWCPLFILNGNYKRINYRSLFGAIRQLQAGL